MLTLTAVEALLPATLFAGKLHYFDEVASTNTLALTAAADGAPEGTVFLAGAQTAGRGRAGHSWHSPPGAGLYLSILLRPALAPADVLWLSLMAGVAVYEAVRESTGIVADLRWPNDLLLGNKKFCGILTEMQRDSAIIGIGVNLNQTAFPDDLAAIATSLRLARERSVAPEPLCAAILRSLDREYKSLLQSARRGSPGHDLLARLPHISTWITGKPVHVPEQGGYDGVTAGLDPRGFLLVQTAAGLRTVLSGGIRER